MEEKLKKLICRYERQMNRSKEKEEDLKDREKDLSKHGFRSLGYFEARVLLYEDVLDDLQELLESVSNEE